jgi:hypothetical protein
MHPVPMEARQDDDLLTVLFIIGGLLLLWLNVQDWYSSQVIVSKNDHVVAERPAPRRSIAHSAPPPPAPARLARFRPACIGSVDDRSEMRAREPASLALKRRLSAFISLTAP